MSPLRVAIVGFGKIARDQHVPAIAATEGVELVAVVDPHTSLPGVPHATTLDRLLRDGPGIDAVAIVIASGPEISLFDALVGQHRLG